MKKVFALFLFCIMIAGFCPFAQAEFTYSVLVTDRDGAPVADVRVQLCTYSTCVARRTGENGTVTFSVPEAGEYEVYILKTPDGYEKSTEVQLTSPDVSQLTFTLNSVSAYPEPEKTYETLDDVNFADYDLILVNFWEPWCKWCVKEMPDLEQIWQEYKDRGLLVIGMYRDENGAQDVIDVTGITYPVIRYASSARYDLTAYPTTVFYDSEGNAIPVSDKGTETKLVGYCDYNTWKTRVEDRIGQ